MISRSLVVLTLLFSASLWQGSPVLPLAHAQEAQATHPQFEWIDGHFHAFSTAPEFFGLLRRLNLRVVNLCALDTHEPGFKDVDLQHIISLDMFRRSGGRVIWVSTFEQASWEQPNFAERVNKALDKTFDQGAVGVKITKSIGM